MKRLIINADDYGWDRDASKGILELIETGSIKSVSIMANHVLYEELKKIRSFPDISTGIHINLSDGKAMSEEAQAGGLCDKEGYFYDSKTLWKNYIKGKVKASAIRSEVLTQINYLRNNGIFISHADSHQHTHHYPWMGKPILQAIKESGIFKIRNSKPVFINSERMKIIKLFSVLSHHHLKTFKHTEGLLSYFSTHNDYSMEGFEQELKKAFSNKDTLELMVHPALENSERSVLYRKKEYDFLKNKNWQEVLKKLDIQVTNYHQI